jgi:Rad3-related DNA helicase
MFHSGTFTRRTVEQLGIELSDVDFFDYYGHVNPAKSPIMYIPTAKVNMYAQPWELNRIVKRIDEIFESRLDRKGIVHTSNYKLRDYIMSNSRYARFFVSNYTQSGDLTSNVIKTFKEMEPPALLVSPSVTTGYDFPYDDCRYQIIAKLNYPYAGSKIEQARVARDPDRGSAHAILHLQQAVGRADRASDDAQEVFIIDDAFPTLKWKYESLFSPAFLACVRTLNKIPKAPMWEAA